jgi:hypothetical protein
MIAPLPASPRPQPADDHRPPAPPHEPAAHAPLRQRFEDRLNRAAQADTGDAPVEAVPLQALLAFTAWPGALLPPQAPPAPAAPPPADITPHDLAATVQSLSVRLPPVTPTHVPQATQWTFGLADALTPLATLRVSGDAVQGWRLHLTPAAGMAPQLLAVRAEKLRSRLQARGHALADLQVDNEEDAPTP